MMFKEIFNQYHWDEVQESIYAKTSLDVEMALSSHRRTLEDFKALISPAAAPYLEEMAQLSHQLTQKRFGNTIQMYAPIYLSNVCTNFCTYCGFNFDNKIKRKTLAKQVVHIDYFKNAIEIIKPHFANISIEVQPLDQEEYEKLRQAGIYAVLVYQETYNQEKYPEYHPKGRKANFDYRLETPDRAGKAGIHKIGVGVLLGLEDWRTDSFFCALHLDYLQKKYWQTKYSVSFPRIRPAEGVLPPNVVVSDREMVQLICAYRLRYENVELSISTRESEQFRNNIIKLGVTSMSAGSKTNPGGYTLDTESLEQFAISDERSSRQMAEYISSINYEPVWKDWDKSFI